jgi:hypothetical protein
MLGFFFIVVFAEFGPFLDKKVILSDFFSVGLPLVIRRLDSKPVSA